MTEALGIKFTNVKKLPYEELKGWMSSKKPFRLVEVLISENYNAGHIPGAINIPTETFESVAPKILKPEETIVLYCRGNDCMLSPRCAGYLVDIGYSDVYQYPGGKAEWISKGEPLQNSKGIHCTLAGCEEVVKPT